MSYMSRECFEEKCAECRDIECECKHEQCIAALHDCDTLWQDLQCNLHKGHDGEHYLEVQWP